MTPFPSCWHAASLTPFVDCIHKSDSSIPTGGMQRHTDGISFCFFLVVTPLQGVIADAEMSFTPHINDAACDSTPRPGTGVGG